MRLSAINFVKTLKKYLRIYRINIKYALMVDTAYRFSFFLELFVEFGYQAVLILFMQVIFSNIGAIAGWSYYEILFLTGLNIISSDIIVGAFGVYNLWALPERIKNGEIDFVLLKPVNSLFSLALSQPYLTSFISSFTGIILMVYSVNQMHLTLNFINILSGMLMLGIGAIIVFCIMCIFGSLSFVFLNASQLPRLPSSMAFQFKIYPHQIYQGIWNFVLYFILPVIFMGSIPAETMLKGLKFEYLLLGIVLIIVFIFLTFKIWNKMIKYYASASS